MIMSICLIFRLLCNKFSCLLIKIDVFNLLTQFIVKLTILFVGIFVRLWLIKFLPVKVKKLLEF